MRSGTFVGLTVTEKWVTRTLSTLALELEFGGELDIFEEDSPPS